MLAVHLEPEDEQRLARLAADRGETVEAIVRRFVVDQLNSLDWPEDSEADWAKSSVSMAAKFLPKEDWEDAPRANDGPG
jgi:hypothetical protein